jgi:hypothetical protein
LKLTIRVRRFEVDGAESRAVAMLISHSVFSVISVVNQFFFRRANFSPDHVASTAHTL